MCRHANTAMIKEKCATFQKEALRLGVTLRGNGYPSPPKTASMPTGSAGHSTGDRRSSVLCEMTSLPAPAPPGTLSGAAWRVGHGMLLKTWLSLLVIVLTAAVLFAVASFVMGRRAEP